MLVYLRDKLRLSGRTTFSRSELGLLMSLYGARVQRGEWRDYAIDSLPDMAVFSIFKSSLEQPLYAVTKVASKSMMKPSQFILSQQNQRLVESASIDDILSYLEERAS